MRPNLDGPNFGFAHRIGQAAKADAIRKGYAQKAAVSQPTSGNSMPLGVTQQVKVRQHVHGEIAAKRSVAVAAIATNSGDLDRALIELDVVGLMSVGCGIEASDRNVDWSVDRYVEVDEAPREMPVTAGAGAIAASRNDVGADQAQEGGGETGISANRSIAASAVAADTGHLKSGLIELHIVRLVGVGTGIVSRHRDVDRVVQREGRVNEAAIKVSIAAVAGVVIPARDCTGVDPAVVGRVAGTDDRVVGAASLPKDRRVAANRRIAIPAIAAPTRKLAGTLMELSRVRLMGISDAMIARHCDVDRIEYRDGSVHQRSREVAIATIPGTVVSGRDHVGAERSEPADASAHCGIGIAAITANPGYLGRRLIENPDVGLMSVGCRVGARLRHIERLECSVAAVDQTPGKVTVSTIPGAVISRLDREQRQGGAREKP